MYVNKDSLSTLAFMLPFLPAMPEKVSVDFEDKRVHIQAHTQDEVRAVRAAFNGAAVVWTKQWNKYLGWLEYTTAVDGIAIEIYAVREAPAMCRIVEEEVEVEREVPVAFERQLVKETRKRLVCPE